MSSRNPSQQRKLKENAQTTKDIGSIGINIDATDRRNATEIAIAMTTVGRMTIMKTKMKIGTDTSDHATPKRTTEIVDAIDIETIVVIQIGETTT